MIIGNKTYKLAWGNLARVRFTALPKEVREAGGLVPLATLLWCAIAEKPNPFLTWEHLVDALDLDKIEDYERELAEVLPKAEDAAEKKSTTSEPSPASNSA